MFYKLLSKLLGYPDETLLAAVPELQASMHQGLAATERIVLERFVRHLADQSLIELQAAYVQTFDLTAQHALHLTHHLFGDDKNRGPALIDLSEYYKGFGLELPIKDAANDSGPNELPDYLPLMLEFSGQLEPEEARMFLSQWTKVFNQLASNLEEAGSPYAPLIRLIEHRAALVQAAA